MPLTLNNTNDDDNTTNTDPIILPENYQKTFLKAKQKVQTFYSHHRHHIQTSHGWIHILAVLDHTEKALSSLLRSSSSLLSNNFNCIPSTKVMLDIKLAALLHDLDDKKYFPNTKGTFPNADGVLQSLGISSSIECESDSYHRIIKMISWVGCSENGNVVPAKIQESNEYYLLIPRWADRLEAVGSRGVVRCFQYNQERGLPLSSAASPRPKSEEELWTRYVCSRNLEDYMKRGGTSTDMISHYYDKLLHISRPPANIVRNRYLEQMAASSTKCLVEVCIRYGRTGVVDQDYINSLACCSKDDK